MNAEDLFDSPDVELRMPADSSFAYMLRSTTAALTARLNFTLDDIEDTKIAVTEALALLVGRASPLVDLTVGFTLAPGHLLLTLRLPASEPVAIDEAGFAWQVLSTMADEVGLTRTDEHVTLTLSARSSVAV